MSPVEHCPPHPTPHPGPGQVREHRAAATVIEACLGALPDSVLSSFPAFQPPQALCVCPSYCLSVLWYVFLPQSHCWSHDCIWLSLQGLALPSCSPDPKAGWGEKGGR